MTVFILACANANKDVVKLFEKSHLARSMYGLTIDMNARKTHGKIAFSYACNQIPVYHIC